MATDTASFQPQDSLSALKSEHAQSGIPPQFLDTRLAAIIARRQWPRSIDHLSPQSTVLDALAFMRDKDLTCAPIVDSAKIGRARIAGILNLFDLVIAVAHSRELDSVSENGSVNLPVFAMPVTQILGSSDESSHTWVYHSDQSVSDILTAFSGGIHRAIIVDQAGLINHGDKFDEKRIERHCYMLTQMDLIRYIVNHPALIGDIANKSLQSLSLIPASASFEHFHAYSSKRKHIDDLRDVPTPSEAGGDTAAPMPSSTASSIRRASVTDSLRFCTVDDSALQAFRLMHRSRTGDVTALCVVELKNFELVGTVSASDFRFISDRNVGMLALRVADFLKATLELLPHERRERTEYMFQVISKPTDTLLQTAKRMVDSEVHRAWLVDELGRPIGCVSISDLIGKLSPLDYKSLAAHESGEKEEL